MRFQAQHSFAGYYSVPPFPCSVLLTPDSLARTVIAKPPTFDCCTSIMIVQVPFFSDRYCHCYSIESHLPYPNLDVWATLRTSSSSSSPIPAAREFLLIEIFASQVIISQISSHVEWGPWKRKYGRLRWSMVKETGWWAGSSNLQLTMQTFACPHYVTGSTGLPQQRKTRSCPRR